MNVQILKNRIAKIRRSLNQKNIAALIVTKPANVTYTTGFSGNDSWVVIAPRTVCLITDSRYTEQAKKECPYCKIIERITTLPKETGRVLKNTKSIKSAAIEKSISISGFEALKKNINVPLKKAPDIIEQLRNIKDKAEIALIKKSAQIAAKALEKTIKKFKTGMTENELAGNLDFEIRKLDAKNSFETIVAFGPNASRPHHQPGKRKLKKNDTILIDFGAKYKGYCCDITRCFTVGKANTYYKKVYEVVKQAQAAAIKIVKPGASIASVDSAARKVITDNFLPLYKHGTGHGIGLEIHEELVITEKRKGKLQPGMIFTIEPGIYLPGKFGIRIEDDILVTHTGHKILTANCP